MRSFLTLIAIVATIAFLVIGNRHWQEKIDVSHFASSQKAEASTETKKEKTAALAAKLMPYTAHWPQQAKNDFQQAIKDQKTYTIAIVGSKAMGTEKQGWASDLKKALLQAYGDQVAVTLFPSDVTSKQFISKKLDKKVADAHPNLVLFEPFVLNDNGSVAPKDTHKNLLKAVKTWKDAVVIIQPSFPIYQASNYPDQVKELKKFAQEQKLPYLDHWKDWPGTNSKDLKKDIEFKNGEQVAPNAKGNKIWFDYLRDYFIAGHS
ncbi:hypothetical protein G4D61_08370 [Bacillus ginsengihumi]|uniref:SGNH/GDSL hydrolase family protein n=1 Tax=Heyndrickxia ginsengihumi TaxID=363870 RepID=A0A0A6VBG6_9BACI|nr:hypothetical protein [Heyndrickxia ginsengihumi]KHD84916.1 hypothetical protein NG54_12660 [Heyndrickxia ginsengihumi]NEY19980.1 hypothetical protein [Heyndrickxia ginsengihumi]